MRVVEVEKKKVAVESRRAREWKRSKKEKKKTRMRLSNDSLHSRPFPRFSEPSSSRPHRDPLGGRGGRNGAGKASGDDKENEN